MRPQDYSYFKVKVKHTEQIIDFLAMEEFNRFLTSHHIKTVFQVVNDDEQITHFSVTHKGGIIRQDNLNYNTIEDYFSSKHNGFSNAHEFYESKEMGYEKYEDYKMVLEGGITDKEVLTTMKKNGFVKGFEQLSVLNNEAAKACKNAHELYVFAKGKGFELFDEFFTASEGGFKDATIYRAAHDKGFDKAIDFEDAQKRGFFNHQDWVFGNEMGFRNHKEGMVYLDLNIVDAPDCTIDQKLVISFIAKLEQGKKASINKLYDLFVKEKETYRYEDNGEMPKWFTTSIESKEDLAKFLLHNELANNYGHYDVEGEFFEVLKIHKRKVVIDGSNVAHNSNGDKNSKPSVKNMMLLVDFLIKKGFEEITIIADASLKHKLEDKQDLPNLEKKVTYLESPAERAADNFLISTVKSSHCLFVSNDTYRDWKLRDPWTAQNIDYYRLSFMVKENEIIMPDLEG